MLDFVISPLKLPSKYLRRQGVVYVATTRVFAGQVFIVEGDAHFVRVLVTRRKRGCLRKRDINFGPLAPLWVKP